MFWDLYRSDRSVQMDKRLAHTKAYTSHKQINPLGFQTHCHLSALTQKTSATFKPRRKWMEDGYGGEFISRMSSINDYLMNELCLMAPGHLFILYRIFYRFLFEFHQFIFWPFC